ncbi:MAG: hypothetical protein J6C46_00950 [Clostridia bacterium]|nr:hypothetical protein [Clostridia bacterium]
MTDKIKNIVVTCVFLVFLFGIFLINIIKAPTDVSTSERRKLAQFPKITLETIGNTKFMREFGDYALDQFIGRDFFRSIKASYLFNVLNQKDNNGIYIAEGHASKTLTDLKENELATTVKNLNRLYNTYLKDMNVYYSIIPDKNYFLAEKNGYPHIDYDKFMQIVKTNINKKISYIDIFECLEIDDYYTTDIHWKQENLEQVTNKLLLEMNKNEYTNQAQTNSSINNVLVKQKEFEKEYEAEELTPFYGTYYGQSALPLESEILRCLINENIKNVTVNILNEAALAEGKVEYIKSDMYDVKSFSGIDPYNVYLSGPKALITLENEKATTDKELVIFRDSFGSSLAPLLTSEYAKITLVDLRYIASPLLKMMVDFKPGQDVLIIYSTEVLNNGSILKIQ